MAVLTIVVTNGSLAASAITASDVQGITASLLQQLNDSTGTSTPNWVLTSVTPS